MSALVALGKITRAPLGNHWPLNGGVGSRAGDLASEAVHVHCGAGERRPRATLENLLTLRRTAVHGMDPMPGTDTSALGAGRHVLGDIESSADFPNAFVVDAEDGQILGFDAVHVRSVRDGEGATLQIVGALRGN